MKKWALVVLIFLLVLLAAFYVFIPGSVRLEKTTWIHANPKGFHRAIMNDENWTKWWPVKDSLQGGSFYFHGNHYTIADKSINTLVLVISADGSSDTTLVNVLTTNNDSVAVSLVGQRHHSAMPLLRLRQYFRSKELDRDLSLLLDSMRTFFARPEHVYGINIKEEKVIDSTLLQNFAIANGYPTIEFIYGLIDQLQQYASSQSAKQTGFPMLNISTEDSVHYLTKVAIPVDKRLKPSGNISYKWMLPGGNILVAEIKGGPGKVLAAFQQMDDYVGDHERLAPAIPFQSLVTDRRAEKDTSKWVTRIYYPVM